jgi:hypothetical protein
MAVLKAAKWYSATLNLSRIFFAYHRHSPSSKSGGGTRFAMERLAIVLKCSLSLSGTAAQASSSMVVFSDLFQFLSNACAVHRESVRLGLSFKLGIEIGQSTVNEQMRSSPDSQKGSLSP